MQGAYCGHVLGENSKTLVSSDVLVGLAHPHPATQPHPTHSPASQKGREAQKYNTGRILWSVARSTANLGILQIAGLCRFTHPNPHCRQPMQLRQSTVKVPVRMWEASCTSTKAPFHVRMRHLTQGKALVGRNVILKHPDVSLVAKTHTETDPGCSTNLLKLGHRHRRGTAGCL